MKSQKKILLTVLVLISGILNSFSQSEYVKQIIIAEGAGTEVYVSSYNPSTGLTTVFDTIHVGYVNDVIIDGSTAFVAATDSVVKYDIDNYVRLDQRKVANVNKLAVYNDYLIAGRWISANDNIWLKAFDKNDLSINVFNINEIDNQTFDIVVENDSAYVVVYGGYGYPSGKIGVVDLNTQTFKRWIDLGTQGEGIGNLLTDGYNLYPVFETWTWNTPADTVGGIGIYSLTNGSYFFDDLNYDILRGFFVNGTALFLQVNGNIGVYDLYNQNLLDTARIDKPTGYGAFCSVAYDRLNFKIYVNESDYFSYGQGYIYDLSGNQLGTYNVGIGADAMDIDYRTVSNDDEIKLPDLVEIFPNPVDKIMYINSCNSVIKYNILDLSGKLIGSEYINNKQFNIDFSVNGKGIYLIQLITDSEIITRKIIVE